MATPTSNYGFVKDAGTQNYDVGVVNANLDSIDAVLKAQDNADKALANRLVPLEAPKSASGTVLINIAAAASGSVAVTFPVGLFATPPVVQATINTNTLSWNCSTATPLTTGVTINVYHNTGATGSTGLNIGWFAHLN